MIEKQPGKWNVKPVIDDAGNRYESAADAARAIGCAPSSIRNAIWRGAPCRGRLYRYEGEPPREQNDGPRDEQYERRSRGGRAGARKRRGKQVDSYLPVRSYSPERARPWDM